MNVIVRALVTSAFIAVLAFQPGSGQAAPQLPGSPIRILFIGNSYTYVNNLPELVRGLAAGMSPAVSIETRQVTEGGATLRKLWNAGAALSAIRGERWDWVVLQEQSSLGATMVNGQAIISDPSRLFWPAVRQFDQEIRRRGARTVVLLTWGPPGKPENSAALAHAYFTIARELGALVIPAGLAWERALRQRPDLPLFMNDNSHPAPAGSYLAALAAVATLLDTTPDTAPLQLRGHATGLDGRQADNVGTLAAIDAATWQLYRRVVAGIRHEMRQAGGYLTVARPEMATMPPLPSGRPVPAGALSGSWSGNLRLFNTPGGQPLTIELAAAASGSASYPGKVVIQLPNPIRQDAVEVTVVGNEIHFEVPSPLDAGAPIRFVGVLTEDNRLEGIASIVSEANGWDFRGTWFATRRK